MRLVVAVVGKPRDRHLAAAIDDYETRAARYWPLEIAEVREASGRGVAPADARDREGTRLLERLPAAALVLACDERGERLTSAQANRFLIEGNVRRADRKEKVDKMAAAILLQSYLDGLPG